MFPRSVRLSAAAAFLLLSLLSTAGAVPTAAIDVWRAEGELTAQADEPREGVAATVTAPLPSAAILFVSGLAGLGLLGRRRRRKAQTMAQGD